MSRVGLYTRTMIDHHYDFMVSYGEYSMWILQLVFCHNEDGRRPNIMEISRSVPISYMTLRKRVQHLVCDGYLNESNSEHDRREKLYALTPKSVSMISALFDLEETGEDGGKPAILTDNEIRYFRGL